MSTRSSSLNCRFTEIINLYPTMQRWARRLMRVDQDADDLCQDACLCALLALTQFEGNAKFSTWLYRILVNCHTDALRKRLARKETSESNLRFVETQKAQNDYLVAVKNETLAERVRASLSHITPRQRQLLKWKYVEGRSHADIAAVLHVQERSVWRAMSRARRAFKTAFEQK